tara:strand:- start:952 stop:1101 length:150 start_codon:yes stop_codon:yes gene_type:complete
MEVSTIAKKLCSVVFISDMERIATEKMKELGECISAAIWYRGWHDRWWS